MNDRPNGKSRFKQFSLLTAMAALSLMLVDRTLAQTFTVLHTFNPRPGSGEPVVAGPDGALYGVTSGGGEIGFGEIFKVNPDGSGYTNLYSFTGGADGSMGGFGIYVPAALVVSGNTLYGTAPGGPASNAFGAPGTLFKIHMDGTGFATLFTFTNANDGAKPQSLVIAGDTLYGTALSGGSLGSGTVFSISTNGTGFTILHSFTGVGVSSSLHATTNSDGYSPDALAVSGNVLYGAAEMGGTNANGTLFSLNLNGGNFTTIHTFTASQINAGQFVNSDGALPTGLLVSGSRLYTTATSAGFNGFGAVIAINTDGTSISNIYSFIGGGDGSFPYGNLALSGNTLYGTASGGGAGNGTVFTLDINGLGFTNLHNFTTPVGQTNSDGAQPQAGLLFLGGTLYGTALLGGSSGAGTVFRVTASGTGFATVYSFPFGLDASGPVGLTLSGNTLYGTAASGGISGNGTVFKVNTDGTDYSSLYDFTATTGFANNDGAAPNTAPVLSGNTLYLGTESGGTTSLGTLVALSTNGGGFSVLHTFTGSTDGQVPRDLILTGNTLYGVMAGGGSASNGTLFAVNLDNTTFTNFHTFTAANLGTNYDGKSPLGLTLAGGTLYGVAIVGGNNAGGTVFKVSTNGTGFAVLHSFTNLDGANPRDRPLVVADMVYGTTSAGGLNGAGTIFRVSTNGTGFTNLYAFTATVGSVATNRDGARPFGRLVGSGNILYGTATAGGTSGSGTIFAINTDGTGFKNLYDFKAGSDGSGPTKLILSGNVLYGVAGTVFSLTLGAGNTLAPLLSISRVNTNILLSWTASGFILQSTTNLSPPVIWSNVASGPNSGTNTISGTQKFYRLSQ